MAIHMAQFLGKKLQPTKGTVPFRNVQCAAGGKVKSLVTREPE